MNAVRFVTQPGMSIRSPVGYRAAGDVATTTDTAMNTDTSAGTTTVMAPADASRVIGACLAGAVVGFAGAAWIGYKIARSAMGGT